LWCRDGLAAGGHQRSYGAGHGYYHGQGGRRAVRRLETPRDRGHRPPRPSGRCDAHHRRRDGKARVLPLPSRNRIVTRWRHPLVAGAIPFVPTNPHNRCPPGLYSQASWSTNSRKSNALPLAVVVRSRPHSALGCSSLADCEKGRMKEVAVG
jgi:hypothetical protein